MKHRTICILSGGVDSTTLLHQLVAGGDEVLAMSFDYGQRHRKEIRYAARSSRKLGVEHMVVDLAGINALLAGSALTSREMEVPEGSYEDEAMRTTVVPNRNMIMMSLAGAYAVSRKYDRIAIAVHAADHAVYPDCRARFIEQFDIALKLGNYEQVSVYVPFLDWTKARIVRLGLRLGIDYEADTWSCYQGGEEPCGKCGTCLERAEALEEARNE
ncbi:MAG: 7-cyano-7-deazaguanine synthase QueC [Thermoleophilia bacterium]|nr:7-cyano-7-deazaguanine synthase QueC [Thermoleophilia bacterium]